MKIIQPAHNIPAEKVKNWREIKKEATEMVTFMKSGNFNGYWKSAFALSQAQISNNPKNYFVLNDEVASGDLVKKFGHWCIMNPRIVQFGDPVYWKEACMSFPFRKERRVDRMNKVTAEYYIPFLGIFWRKTKRKFDGLPAFILQHEIEHATGQNIYKK